MGSGKLVAGGVAGIFAAGAAVGGVGTAAATGAAIVIGPVGWGVLGATSLVSAIYTGIEIRRN